MRKAVVDVGSNSVLLTVEESQDGSWRTVFESSEVTSLGKATKQTGVLSEASMADTLAALERAFGRAQAFGAESTVAAATMAARIANNASDFLDRARAQGTPVFVLSGNREAELGFRAVANDPKFANEALISIVDPGGQSTELVTAERAGSDWIELFRQSVPIGTLGLRGGVLASERLDSADLLRATVEIDLAIGSAYGCKDSGYAVALGASGTNLVTIREAMETWQPDRVHGALLSFEEISRAVDSLSRMSDAERAAVPGIEPGREGTIHVGALILERFLFAIRADGCAVSVRGWRHALLEEG